MSGDLELKTLTQRRHLYEIDMRSSVGVCDLYWPAANTELNLSPLGSLDDSCSNECLGVHETAPGSSCPKTTSRSPKVAAGYDTLHQVVSAIACVIISSGYRYKSIFNAYTSGHKALQSGLYAGRKKEYFAYGEILVSMSQSCYINHPAGEFYHNHSMMQPADGGTVSCLCICHRDRH